MANTKKISTDGVLTYTIDTTAVINLGEAAEGVVGSWTIHFLGAGSYSVVLRKKLRRSSLADASAPTTYYENHSTGVSTAAGTAIATPTLVVVPANGCDVILDITYTSGVCTIEAVPLLG